MKMQDDGRPASPREAANYQSTAPSQEGNGKRTLEGAFEEPPEKKQEKLADALSPSVASTAAASSPASLTPAPVKQPLVGLLAAALEEVGLEAALGQRLEVLWDVEVNGEQQEKWWGCTLVKGTDERDTEGRPIFLLEFDAWEDFDSEETKVIFKSKYHVADAESGDELRWRIEGANNDEEEARAEYSNATLSMTEVVEAQRELEAAAGVSIEALGLQAMQQLPMHQQMAIASSYRVLADAVKDKLRALMTRKAAASVEVLVSAQEMEDIVSQVRREAATQLGLYR